ncbi:MAG: amidohydrolase [Cyclobacteriaceae bacterium]
MKKYLLLSFLLVTVFSVFAQKIKDSEIIEKAKAIEKKVIEWRRDIHANPELSNREFKTAEKIAAHLKSLGIEVQTGVAHTGVVGILKGGKPGPVIGLRADMDALPVTERVDLPFASKVQSEYNGITTGVMHACGHDVHVAALMGVAEVLAGMKKNLRGTVKFVFQPAEEGAPEGEEGGAALMIKEGVMKAPDIDVMFGFHISAGTPVGQINYRPRGIMAAADRFVIKVKGKQTHGSRPWGGIDPITVSSQIVQGLNNIVSRQTELTKEAAIISVGLIRGGIRNNIIPEEVELIGTIRTLDNDMQKKVHEKIKLTATKIAESAGATAEVDIQVGYPVTYNDPQLTKKMVGSLAKATENVVEINAITGAEDFSFYAQEVPGFFFFVGGLPEDVKPEEASAHHTPDFFIDESGILTGVKAMLFLTMDYMSMR